MEGRMPSIVESTLRCFRKVDFEECKYVESTLANVGILSQQAQLSCIEHHFCTLRYKLSEIDRNQHEQEDYLTYSLS